MEKLSFLDVTVIKNEQGKIETDIYYKETNNHEYLNYNSHHPTHIKNNIPFNLAKRIIVFCSNPFTETTRLEELKTWLLNCDFPPDIITRGFHHSKLPGFAPQIKNKEKNLTFVTTFFSNYDSSNILKLTNNRLTSSKNDRIQNACTNINTVLALRQPKNLIRHITTAKLQSNSSRPEPGLLRRQKM